jgi:hypothetical protein
LLAVVAGLPATASPINAEVVSSPVAPLVSDKEVADAWAGVREMSLDDAVVKGFARREWKTPTSPKELSPLEKRQWTSRWVCDFNSNGE